DSPPPPISPRPIKPSSVSTSTIVRTKRPQWQPFAWRSGASKGTVTVVARMSVIFINGRRALGTHRFQRAVSAGGASENIGLSSRDCALEAMRTQASANQSSPNKALRLVLFESLLRLLNALWQRALGESLKIEQARIAPMNRVALLNLQLLRDFGVTYRINRSGQRIPLLARGSRPIYAALIMQRQFIPQDPSRTHAMIPRDVMEPGQKLLRARAQVGEEVTRRRVILAYGIAPGLRAVEAKAAFVGAVIIGRVPIGAPLFLPPRRGAVMMPAPHNVMQPKRRHVIHQRLM